MDSAKSEVTRWKRIRDQFKKLSEELESDRESGSSHRYQHSITDLIERIETLQTTFDQMHDLLLNFDQRLAT